MKMKAILLKYLFSISLILSFINYSFANERIVVAGGSLTEIIYSLGSGEQIVGVDQTSSYPAEVKKLPQIGYWKLLNIEGILSLTPSLFITWIDAEPNDILEQVSKAKVDVLALQRVPATPELLYQNIEKIGFKLNNELAAKQLVNQIRNHLTEIQQKIAKQPQKIKVLFLLSMGGSNTIAGKNTVADAIITIAGGENIATHTSYKSYSAESLIASNPEAIILTSQSVEQLGGLDKLSSIPGLTQTQAWKNRRIITIDQAYLLGLGPRVTQAVDTLYSGFYPEN